MKECPNCKTSLPMEAFFCPNCMYEYFKVEIIPKATMSKGKKRKILLIVIFMIVVSLVTGINILLTVYRKHLQEEMEKVNTDEIISEYFGTVETTASTKNIQYDLKNSLGDFQIVQQELGITSQGYEEGDFMCYTIDGGEVAVNTWNEVQYIYIDYSASSDLEKYGVYGICGTSSIDDVIGILGVPDQGIEGGEQYRYRLDGELGAPTILFTFNSERMVTSIDFYKML